jgi:phage/plasmid-like protein (TIGR03299 family)
MPANLETMFYVRQVPWHGLGVRVEEALSSEEALREAGLDWRVIQKPIYTADLVCSSGNVYTSDSQLIHNYKANVRDSDGQVLGVVTDRYRIVQNEEAFAFTDALLGEGVKYETAGSLQNGRRVWMLARLPEKYIIGGECIEPFLVFSNSHDGTAAIKVCMTPIRVVCQNTLNLALDQARRSWAAKHTGNVQNRMHEARETLGLAHRYMEKLGGEVDRLSRIKLPDSKVLEFINELIPLQDEATDIQRKNVEQLREDMKIRYFEAPDLKGVGKNGYRFVCAISDFATHAKPLRETASYKENLFLKTLEGHPIIDKAYVMVKAA